MAQRVKHPEILKAAYAAADLSGHEVARKAGFSQSSKLNLSRHGQRDLSLHELRGVASAVGVDWWTLLPIFGGEFSIPDPTAQEEAMTELARLSQEMGLYDVGSGP